MWDLGGQTSIRPYWRCYYANTAAVIFVVDSTDIERLQTAADELAAMLNEEELKDAALLVFANKQDQPGAKGAADISQALRLGELRDRNWSIMACSAVDGSGVNEGMDWLVVSHLRSKSGLRYIARNEADKTNPCATSKRFRRSNEPGTGGREYLPLCITAMICIATFAITYYEAETFWVDSGAEMRGPASAFLGGNGSP